MNTFQNGIICQNDIGSYVNSFSSSSPESDALLKFSDIPVDLASGTPTINVPLTSITEGQINVPVSLSYHASGIRVDDFATWSGLGWNLNAGGMVSRKVNGLPDDADIGIGFLQYRLTHTPQEIVDGYINEDENLFSTIAQGCWDTEPDEFYFSFSGYSGKFLFDWTNSLIPIVSSAEGVIVEISSFSGNKIQGFNIKTPDGLIFRFLTPENTRRLAIGNTQSQPCNVDVEYNSSWHLSSIEYPPTSKQIYFTYVEESPLDFDWLSIDYKNYTSLFPSGDNPILGQSYRTLIWPKRLTTITTSTNLYRIDFVANTLREDIAPNSYGSGQNYRLDEIILKAGTTVIQKFAFDYFYQGNRLMLDKIYQKSVSGGNTSLIYRDFGYNTSILPVRNDKNIDHWGFYNGNNNNQSLVPSHHSLTGSFIPGANRSSDPEEAEAQILSKVEYPTGGWTELEYEGHDYGFIQSTPVITLDQYETINKSVSSTSSATIDGQVVTNTEYFTINAGVEAPTVFCIQGLSAICGIGGSPFPASASLSKLVNGSWIPIWGETLGTGYTNYCFNWETVNPNEDLEPGEYQLVTSAQHNPLCGNDPPYNYISVVINWKEYNLLSPLAEKPAGGVRIKQMRHYDGMNEPVIKDYEYKTVIGETLVSSGTIEAEPRYWLDGHIMSSLPPPTLYFIQYFGSNLVVAGSTNGSHITYRKVTVREPGNGATIYNFTYVHDQIISVRPFGNPISNDFRRGLPESEYVYKEDGSLVMSNSYVYHFQEFNVQNPRIRNGKISCAGSLNQNCYSIEFSSRYAFIMADVRIGYSKLIQKTTSLDGVTTETNYNYDNDFHFMKSSSFVNSDNKEYRTEIRYAHDVNSSDHPAKLAMLYQHMNGIPLETFNYVDNLLIGGNKVVYQDFSNMLLPWKFYNIEDANGILESGDWVLKGTMEEYYTTVGLNQGLPKIVNLSNYPFPIEYTFEDGLLKKKNYGGRNWKYTYFAGNRLLRYEEDYNGQRTGFEYDNYLRPFKTKMRPDPDTYTNWKIITTNEYAYRTNGGYLNYTVSTTTFADAPTIATKQFFDGLGRQIENISLGHAPNGSDVYTALEYDANGRMYKKYLPWEGGTSGGYQAPGFSYSQTKYEPSPLNRVVTQILPSFGEILYQYGSNGSNDVKNHLTGGFYSAGTLVKRIAIDENGNPDELYADKAGRTILSRQYVENQGGGSEQVNTYYVYEDDGDLSHVVPPLATGMNDLLYAYQYTYDARHRLITKKVPGSGLLTIGYNNRDEVTSMLDANGNNNTFEYDDYGRQTKTYLNSNLILENFYVGKKDWLDVTLTLVMDENTPNWWLQTNNVLDDYGRTLQMISDNHLGIDKEDTHTFSYTHADYLLNSTRLHEGYSGDPVNITQINGYDNAHRLQDITHQVSGGGALGVGPVHLLHHEYNFRDELIQKKLHETQAGAAFPFLQKIDFEYNLRGFLTKINDFDMEHKIYSAIPICPDPPIDPEPEEEECEVKVVKEVALTLVINKTQLLQNQAKNALFRFEAKQLPCKESALEKDTFYIGTNLFLETSYTDTLNIILETAVYDSVSKAMAMKEAAIMLAESFTNEGVPPSVSFDPQTAAIAAESANYNPATGTQVEQFIQYSLYSLSNLLEPDPYDGTGTSIPYTSLDQNDLFAMQLFYASTNTTAGAYGQLNGNISQMIWQVAGREQQSYGFDYDGLDRLKSAKYTNVICPEEGACEYITNDMFSVSTISYDQHGNIKHIERNGLVETEANGRYCYDIQKIDLMDYFYNGNQLTGIEDHTNNPKGFKDVVDAGDEYTYDANGNLTADFNKGITSITYNHLNLPKHLTFSTGASIQFLYTAGGEMLRKTTTSPENEINVYDYISGIEYKNETLTAIFHQEGKVKIEKNPVDDTNYWQYEYVLRDHLGNTRIVFEDTNQDGFIQYDFEISQEEHYYPFGMTFDGPWNPLQQSYRQQFNGKEKHDDFDLGWYAYGARWYDPAIGRWSTMDPMAEEYFSWSPYNYCLGNPVLWIDPFGLEAVTSQKEFPPADFKGNIWIDSYGVFTRSSNSDGWDWYNSDGYQGGVWGEVTIVGSKENTAQDVSQNSNPAGESTLTVSSTAEASGSSSTFTDWNYTHGKDYSSQVEAYRAWQSYSGYYEGEDWWDHLFRIIAFNSMEARRDYASGAYSSAGGFGRVPGVANGGLKFNNGVKEAFIKHFNSGGRHADLGLSVETMASKAMNLVKNNMHLLKAGDNTLIGNINGIQKSFKAFVQDGKILSVNMYPGVSNRVNQGTIIKYGNITW